MKNEEKCEKPKETFASLMVKYEHLKKELQQMKKLKVTDDIVLYAMRFAINQYNVPVNQYITFLRQVWNELLPYTRELVQAEIKNHFDGKRRKRDDCLRRNPSHEKYVELDNEEPKWMEILKWC